MKIVPLELNMKLSQTKFMKKLILEEYPKIICDKYPLNYNSSINNSDQTKLIVPYFRTNLRTFSLAFKGYKVWNDIPKHSKELCSIKLFVKKYSYIHLFVLLLQCVLNVNDLNYFSM